MAKKILNESYIFSCSKSLLPKPFIQVKDPQSKAYDASGQKILTSGAKCKMTEPPPCLNNPNPAQPPVPPYLLCCLSAHSPWRNTNSTMTVGGKDTLSKNSTCTCNSKGGTISCQIPSRNSKIQTGAMVTSLSAIASITAQAVSSSKATVGKATTVSPSNVIQEVALASVAVSPVTGDSLVGGSVVGSQKEETSPEDSTPKVEEEEPETQEYMCCDYKNCKETATCDYYNVELSSTSDSTLLKEKYKQSIKNDSTPLKRNYKNIFKHEEETYREKVEKLTSPPHNNGFTTAAHHLVSGNQCFLSRTGKKNSGNFRAGKLVRLAIFYGYDINNGMNCILLPTSNDESVRTQNKELRTSAFDIMSKMKAQWHVGGHCYSIPDDTRKHIQKHFTQNPQEASMGGDTLIDNYANLVIGELEKLEKQKYTRNRCRMAKKEKDAEVFKEQMNQISKNVKQKLELFQENAKKSFPYYVSITALSYAFDIPSTLKLMVIYETPTGKVGEIFRIKPSAKDGSKIVTTTEKKQLLDGSSAFVKFCSNVTCFLDLQGEVLDLGFYPRTVSGGEDVRVYPLGLSKKWDEKQEISTYLKDNKDELLAEMTKHDLTYQGETSIQSIRMRTLKQGE